MFEQDINGGRRIDCYQRTSHILASVRLVNDGMPGGPPWTSVNMESNLKNDCDC